MKFETTRGKYQSFISVVYIVRDCAIHAGYLDSYSI